MNRDELQALVARLRDTSVGIAESSLEIDRQRAVDFYHGRWKPAPEGRSQIVDRTFMDTIEWAMPQIMGVFSSTDELVRFDPTGPEDEELAEQETAVVNHELMNKGDGFLVVHDAVKDALMLRNGYIKCVWEEEEKTSIERYQYLTEDALAKLAADYVEEGADVEEIEREETQVLTEMGPAPVLNVTLRVTTKQGKLCSYAIPPEEIIVSEDARGHIQKLPFLGHLTTKRRTELLEMGMKRSFVDDLPAYGEDDNENTAGRRGVVHDDDAEVALDSSMDEIEYLEAYVKVDYNGDGKSELRKVVLVAGQIPDGKEWIEEVDCIPFATGVPIRMPHRHTGVSYFDLLCDLQEIRTTLDRQLLDNVYLTNNQRPVVNELVSLKDLAVSKPGAPIRVEGDSPPMQNIGWASPTPIIQQLLPVLDLMDSIKESRTGIGRNNTNIDPDVLNNAPDALVARAQTAANAKLEMIIRLLAETLIKDWARLAHKYLIKYSDKAMVFKLRGQYIPVDPREWKERDDMTISVGLGTGTEEEKQRRFALLAGLMERADAKGIVTGPNAYNFASDASKALGFKMAERYFTDPSTPEFQQQQAQARQAQEQAAQVQFQQQAEMLANIEKVKGQYRLQGEQMKSQADLKKKQIDHQHQMHKLSAEDRRQMREIAFKMRELSERNGIDIAKMEVDAFIQGASVDLGEPGMGAELNG